MYHTDIYLPPGTRSVLSLIPLAVPLKSFSSYCFLLCTGLENLEERPGDCFLLQTTQTERDRESGRGREGGSGRG